MECKMIQELLPWYPGGLTSEEAVQVAGHLRSCPSCQAEFAQVHRLRALVHGAVVAGPVLRPGVWQKVALRTIGIGLGRLRLGSEALGFSLSLAVRRKTLPVLLELFVLGRKVPIFEYAGGER